jgi:hypothetical protein
VALERHAGNEEPYVGGALEQDQEDRDAISSVLCDTEKDDIFKYAL